MNKSQKTLLINNLKECLSYLLPDDSYINDSNIEQQTSKDKNRDIVRLLTSIISDIKLAKLLNIKEPLSSVGRETILQLINEEASKGRFFTKTQFCYFFEDRFGLKSHHSIRKHINVLATEGYIKFREKEVPRNNRRVKVMELQDEKPLENKIGHYF